MTDLDVEYATNVLKGAGVTVQRGNPDLESSCDWHAFTEDGRRLHLTTAALVELAHDEARRRHQRATAPCLDAEQPAMFEHESTPRFEVL